MSLAEGGKEGENGGAPLLDEGTLDLIRKFSVIKPATSFFTTANLIQMVSTGDDKVYGVGRLTAYTICLAPFCFLHSRLSQSPSPCVRVIIVD